MAASIAGNDKPAERLAGGFSFALLGWFKAMSSDRRKKGGLMRFLFRMISMG